MRVRATRIGRVPESVVVVRIPAKINIRLDVGPVRPDGFHDLHTVFHAVDLFDTVTASEADELSLRLTGPESAGLPVDEANLGWRAAALLADRASIEPRVALAIDKSIPVAAGLAGGSADAAGVLAACNELWHLGLGPGDLAELAGRLGSDVAFGLTGRTAVGTGRGELLAPVAGAARFHWVLAAAHGELSTPAVYAELDRLRSSDPHCAARIRPESGNERGFGAHNASGDEALRAALVGGDASALAPLLSNDLQEPALNLAPYLADTLRSGAELGALAGIVSGSGPTCAFLVADAAAAHTLADALGASGSCRFARPVLGGVAGAGIINEKAAR